MIILNSHSIPAFTDDAGLRRSTLTFRCIAVSSCTVVFRLRAQPIINCSEYILFFLYLAIM